MATIGHCVGHETASVNVMGTPLLIKPDVVTNTSPLVAPLGMGTVMLVGVQITFGAVEETGVPLNTTIPDVPKLIPLSVIGVPALPLVIRRLTMTG